MLKINKVIIIILLILFSFNLYSEEKEEIYYDEKDPFVAGLLSATMLGLGQFYTKDYLKGSIYVFTDLLQKGMIIYLVTYLSDHYTNDEDDKIVEWKEINNSDRAIVIGFITFYFGSRLLCIIDAINGAKSYNKSLREEFSNSKVKVNYLLSEKNVGLGFSTHF